MKKSFLTVAVAFLLAAVLAACGTGPTGEPQEEDFRTDIQLGTGSVGGTYFPLGGEMATLLSDEVDIEGFNVSSVESGASVENLAKIGTGEFQLGMTVNGTAQDAMNGEGEFEGRPVENFGFMIQIYPEVMHVVTLERTGIESIADLEGKRVAIGPPGSATQSATRGILAAYGIEDGDYQAFEEGFGDAAGRLQDGNLDASFAILGSPASSVDELQATTGQVRYLEIEGDALERFTGETFYEPYEIPADHYAWLEEPVSTVSAYAILVGSTNQIDEETGYQITKVLAERAAEEISHPQAENMTKENALLGRLDLPLHPGAERYYREEGMLD
ncbi:TAXI family TRAP transporter solute-binding subunit [Rubrobacter taiwanensis]|uniref:TAXI family TRAP transporter solute-binding subunit n=1 Tax=Rubrobacter taiwanensis TaxID=185139 RepID=UPI001A9ED81E|nr:TAXI family TRAP transporter solute-binding subunit [Rubrobacter taiwanensis]